METPHCRIIKGAPDLSSSPPFTLSQGPFDEQTLTQFPDRDCTLLVDHVNHYFPHLNKLLDKFSFIPNWRLDDIMISFAPKGGSVGPHIDNYDVFLVQAAGTRLWKTSTNPISPENERLIPDIDVRVLENGFEADIEHVLKPGDALYVPPRFPHHGISLDQDCVTYSIGFRAPTIANLLTAWVDRVIESERLHEKFYQDSLPSLLSSFSDPGKVDSKTFSRAFELVNQYLPKTEDASFRQWFASETSMPKTFVDVDNTFLQCNGKDAITKILSSSSSGESGSQITVRHREGSVFSYLLNEDDSVSLYINGDSCNVSHMSIASFICLKRIRIAPEYASLISKWKSCTSLLEKLFHNGLLYIDDGTMADSDCEENEAEDADAYVLQDMSDSVTSV